MDLQPASGDRGPRPRAERQDDIVPAAHQVGVVDIEITLRRQREKWIGPSTGRLEYSAEAVGVPKASTCSSKFSDVRRRTENPLVSSRVPRQVFSADATERPTYFFAAISVVASSPAMKKPLSRERSFA
jgi:hypothetical protein